MECNQESVGLSPLFSQISENRFAARCVSHYAVRQSTRTTKSGLSNKRAHKISKGSRESLSLSGVEL